MTKKKKAKKLKVPFNKEFKARIKNISKITNDLDSLLSRYVSAIDEIVHEGVDLPYLDEEMDYIEKERIAAAKRADKAEEEARKLQSKNIVLKAQIADLQKEVKLPPKLEKLIVKALKKK